MFSKKKQSKFLGKNRNRIISHLRVFCEKKEPEELHKIRVEIKKLKAFIYFLKKHSSNKYFPDALELVQHVFKHAGLIRSAQVNLDLAEQFHLKNRIFREEQLKIIEAESLEFCLNKQASIRNVKNAGQLILPYFRGIKDKRILKFFNKEIKKSGRKLQKDLSTEEWHRLRKKLKILLYVYQLPGMRLSGKLNLNITYLEDLEQSIGKWHDTVLASGFVNQKTKSGKALAAKFLHQIERQKEELIGKAQDFIKKSAHQ